MQKKVLAIFLLVLMLIPMTLFAKGSAEEAKGTKPVSLVHDKSGSPSYQPFFEGMAEIVYDRTGVRMEPTAYPSTDVFMAQVRSSMLTKNAPGLFTWWSTYRMKEMVDSGVLADTSALWDKYKDDYPQGLRDAFTFDNKAYGFPYSIEYWVVWYNKDVFKQYNLSEPKTWQEFTALSEKLIANGVTPLLTTVEGRWPTFIIFEELVMRESPELYKDLCEGRVKYSDPRVVKAFNMWGDMIRKGYFTSPGTDVWAAGARDFNQGKVAMAPFGTWYMDTLTSNGVPEEKIGAFVMPSHNPSAGNTVITEMSPILVSKNAENLEDAMKVADYWMSAEGNEVFAKYVTFYPANASSKTDFLPQIKKEIAEKIAKGNYQVSNRYWEATPTPICETAVDLFAKFMIDPSTQASVIAELDKVADDYWASVK